MQNVFLKYCLLFLFAALVSCEAKENFPKAAISFEDSEESLMQKEKNNLFRKSNWYDHRDNTIFHELKHSDYKYLTANNDTIQYFFINNHLSGIVIDVYENPIENVVNDFNNNPYAQKIADKEYVIGNEYFFIGEREDAKPYIVILNNENGEVEDIVRIWNADTNFNRKFTSGDQIYVTFLLGKIGQATGLILINNFEALNEKYYNRLLKTMAEKMAKIELRNF